MLALSVDADRFTVEEFWKDHDYAFPVAMRAPAHTQAFGPVKATPTLYLIDRKGVLRMARIGGLGQDKLEAQSAAAAATDLLQVLDDSAAGLLVGFQHIAQE
jgi:hypothetical protein